MTTGTNSLSGGNKHIAAVAGDNVCNGSKAAPTTYGSNGWKADTCRSARVGRQ